MSKAEWGLKRICPHCNTRYYDMKKNPPVCPSCGSAFDVEALVKSRRGRITAEEKARRAGAAAPEETIDDIPVAGGDDAEDAVIEDADELGDVDVDEVAAVEADDE